jgi:hypothetical protein
MLREMSLEGANYVQDFPKCFSKIKQYHARKICPKEYFNCKLKNGMEI